MSWARCDTPSLAILGHRCGRRDFESLEPGAAVRFPALFSKKPWFQMVKSDLEKVAVQGINYVVWRTKWQSRDLACYGG